MLSPAEQDVLQEMMNIASGRAAGTLSGFLNKRVNISLIQIAILDRQGIFDFLEKELGTIGSAVEQRFSGGLTGTSMMMMDYQSCTALVNLLKEQIGISGSENLYEQSILYEIGNVILNSCVAMLGKQTGKRMNFSLPHVYYNLRGRTIAENLTSPADPHIYAVAMKSSLTVGEISFHLHILIFLIVSLDELKAILQSALNI